MKSILVALFITLTFLTHASSVQAQTVNPSPVPSPRLINNDGDDRLPDNSPFSTLVPSFLSAIKLNQNFTSIEGIVGSLIPLFFVLAGIILLFMLIYGGFTLLTAATNPDRAQQGKQILTMAIGGFLIIFTSIWIAQIIGFVFGVKIFEP